MWRKKPAVGSKKAKKEYSIKFATDDEHVVYAVWADGERHVCKEVTAKDLLRKQGPTIGRQSVPDSFWEGKMTSTGNDLNLREIRRKGATWLQL